MKSRILLPVLLLAGMTTVSFSQSFENETSILSGLHDVSNLSGSGTDFRFNFARSSGDPDTYINNVSYSFGTWDSGLDFDMDFQSLNSYTFGTALTGNLFDTMSVARRFGAIDAGVANGFYDFSVDILGGEDDQTFNSLATFDFTLEVADMLDVSASAVLDNTIVPQTTTTMMTMTVSNHMAGTDFVTTTWYLSSGVNSAAFSMPFNFEGNWFNQTIGGGGSLTDLHSSFTPDLSTPLGLYNAYGGVYGGLYFGDEHSVSFDQTPAFEVTAVPEPTSMAILGGGALLAAFRRRRK